MIKLSIIIPYKDTPETLFELLQTIPDCPEYEVVLVDDSSKNPFCVCGFQGKNIISYENSSGLKGAGAARNLGVSKARGKWLVFADSDDWFTENAFLVFERHIRNNADIIYFRPESRHHFIGAVASRHSDYANLVHEFLRYQSDWIRYRFHSPWSKMIKRNLFIRNDIWFDNTYVANDIVCSLKLGLYAQRIEASSDSVYIVRQGRPNSLSAQRDERAFDIRLKNHFRYNALIYENKLGHRAMGGASTLRKSLNIGYSKFLRVLFTFIFKKQPIFEKPSYYLVLIRRTFRRGKF